MANLTQPGSLCLSLPAGSGYGWGTTRTVRPDMIAEKDGVRYIVEVKDWNAWNFSQGIQGADSRP
jgi:hypothetical protein